MAKLRTVKKAIGRERAIDRKIDVLLAGRHDWCRVISDEQIYVVEPDGYYLGIKVEKYP